MCEDALTRTAGMNYRYRQGRRGAEVLVDSGDLVKAISTAVNALGALRSSDPDGGFDSDDGATRSYDAASWDAAIEAAADTVNGCAYGDMRTRAHRTRLADAVRELKGAAGECRPAATHRPEAGYLNCPCADCAATARDCRAAVDRAKPKPRLREVVTDAKRKPARKGGKRRGT